MSGDLAMVSGFLFREASDLDRGYLDRWLASLCSDVVYRVPVRNTRYGTADDEFSTVSFHFDEDLYSLTKRVERLNTMFAWAEDPPTRSRHFVTNVHLDVVDEPADDVIHVRSNLMLSRTRWDHARSEVVTGERVDALRRTGTGLKLARRIVYLDQTTLPMGSISTFL